MFGNLKILLYICITKFNKATNTMAEEMEEKVLIAFKCSPEMKEFIEEEAGEETVSTYLRTLIKREMTESELIADGRGSN